MIKSFLIIIWSILVQPNLFAQLKGGVEQYHYLGTPGETAIVPMVHFETKKGWYAEARYNYDEMKTFSFYYGKSFSHDKNLSWTFTPMLGVAVGDLKAGSVGLNIDMERKKIFLSAQSQFTAALDKQHLNFFYNWSEAGYNITDWLYAGVSLQQTIMAKESFTEKGAMIGFAFKKFSVPIYFFNPLHPNRYFIIGIDWEWK